MRRSIFMTHPNTTVCGSLRRDYAHHCGCGSAVALPATVTRPYWEARQMLETLEATGSVVTHLSVLGMTIVKGA